MIYLHGVRLLAARFSRLLPVAAIAVYALLISPIPAPATVTGPTAGLVGYWSFDEGRGSTAADGSGNKLNGTIIGTPAWTQGVINSAIQLTGSDYVDLGSSSLLKPATGISLVAWVQATGKSTGSPVMSFDGGSVSGYELDWKDSGSSTALGATFSIWNGSSVSSVFANMSGIVPGEWYLLIGTYDSPSGKLVLYVNGVPKTTLNLKAGVQIVYPGFGTQHVNIGAKAGANLLKAAVDEARIYNSALSSGQALVLFTMHNGPLAPPSPTISAFSASPTSVTAGGASTLSWTTANATAVSISPTVSGTLAAAGGSVPVSPSSSTTYTLTASNAVGSVTSQITVSVTVPPPTITTFSANPTTVTSGSATTLSWATKNATSVAISPSVSGTVAAGSGSVSVSPSSSTTYTLTGTNSAGSVASKVTVTVSAAAPTGGSVKILYPANGASLPLSGFVQAYIAATTVTPSTCYYSLTSTGLASMTPFSNTGGQIFHTALIEPAVYTPITYYVQCQDSATSNVTPLQTVTFSFSAGAGNVPANLRPIATSNSSVLIEWDDPNSSDNHTFNVFRNGALVANTSLASYVDTGLTAGTTYTYSVAELEVGSGVQANSIARRPAYTPPVTVTTAAVPYAELDDFESPLRAVNPTEIRPDQKYLWGQYPFTDLGDVQLSDGLASVTTVTAESGAQSLADTISGYLPPLGSIYDGITVGAGMFTMPGSAYLQLYPYSDATNLWGFARQYVQGQPWQFDTYNRLRFWVKVPAGYTKFYNALNPGQTDMDFGSYVSASHANHMGSGGAESGFGGDHYYHRFRLIQTDQWQQVIVDTHPHHQRGGSGSMEWGNMPYPTGETGYNYFDALTRFYLDFTGTDPNTGKPLAFDSYPVTFYFDGFEFYKDTNPENVDQIFSISGVYIPATNEIALSWAHPKNDGTTKYEVRYSFQDAYTLPGTLTNQWSLCTAAPSGVITPYDDVYDMMQYQTTGISVTGHTTIYVVIKPQNSSNFRQIAIPLGN